MATVGFPPPPAELCARRPLSFSSSRGGAKQVTIRVRCSAEAAAEESAPAAPPPTESPVGTPKRSPSLISALNIQKALRGIPIADVDHYGRLGITRGTPYDQVRAAYKNKCEELMNQGLDEEKASKELELLKESYAILSSEDERRLYDWSLARSEKPDRYVWPFQVDTMQVPTEPPPPQEPEDVGPTRLVGYFFLGWLVLSFVLSVTLNR